MTKDIETRCYKTKTTTLTLVRIGEFVEVLCSNKTVAKSLYKELAEKFNQIKTS